MGISLCDAHLASKDPKETSMDDVVKHIEYYLSAGCENSLCIGADWDGIDTTPDGVSSIHCIPALADYLRANGWSDALLHKLFYQNAADFFTRQNIPF